MRGYYEIRYRISCVDISPGSMNSSVTLQQMITMHADASAAGLKYRSSRQFVVDTSCGG